MKIDFNSGGAKVIDRILVAYGFKKKLQLCHHLGVSSANLSMRYKRDFFPSDLVVRCMADTDVTLKWLISGIGAQQDTIVENTNVLKTMEIHNGKLKALTNTVLDKALLPEYAGDFRLIKTSGHFYVVEYESKEVFSGKYLLEIEGCIGVYDIQRYPVNRLKISGAGLLETIECKLKDIKVLAKVVTVIQQL